MVNLLIALAVGVAPIAAVSVYLREGFRNGDRPGGFPTVAVVPGGQCAELSAPVPVAVRRYLVIVLVGQADGRLRVHRLRIGAAAVNAGWGGRGTSDVLGLTGWARE
jgi:hypothetical protein